MSLESGSDVYVGPRPAEILRSRTAERFFDAAVLLACVYLVLIFFPRELLLSTTTATGGDMGAHHYVPLYLRNHLLPAGGITGWAPGWYAGFPALTFYFPLPAVVIALISYLIPYEVAFKLVTTAGSLLLPVSAYIAFKLLDFDFPMPAAAALMTIPFLTMQSFSINGGNLLSTLAGEFGYSIAFALCLPLIAMLQRALTTGRAPVGSAFLLSTATLCHAVPVIVAIVSALPSLAGRDFGRRCSRLIGIVGLGFLLCAFWSLPFIANLGYTAGLIWRQTSEFGSLFTGEIRIVAALAAAGLLIALATRERRLVSFATLAVASLTAYLYLPNGPIWRGRFLPFWYLALAVFAAYAIYSLARLSALLFGSRSRASSSIAVALVFLPVLFLVVAPPVRSATTARTWIDWNYSGFEGKPDWARYRSLNDYLKSLPSGRVMWEYSPDYGKYGTPRALEMIPYWSGQPTMEGTLIESSLTAPFHFINQAEISESPSYAFSGVSYPKFDLKTGLRHLELYNVRYLILVSAKAKASAASANLEPLKSFDEFSVYELKTAGYVTIPKFKPFRGDERRWREISLAWYGDRDRLDVPIVFGDGAPLTSFRETGSAGENVKQPLDVDGSVKEVRLSDEEVEFRTTAVGAPHLVAVSYFPNWKVEGADGPYLVTPSLMMVIPKSERVRLFYGLTWSDYLGRALTPAALLFCLVRMRRRRDRAKHSRTIPFLRPGGPDSLGPA